MFFRHSHMIKPLEEMKEKLFILYESFTLVNRDVFVIEFRDQDAHTANDLESTY